ncbi:right-handed parallel beta-helix repeat-containing protein [Peribacillus frigoritolerans]|uniref:right-handed parallel beta-helix repeat-containing protein n=1 Tax=Peribacillus frigoritolerans TaxID=450367 RepID=UPI003D0453F2
MSDKKFGNQLSGVDEEARAQLADISNVTVSITDKRFGAKSDGTDQSNKMQAAVDYIASLGGGLVIIPFGKFKGNITISKSNVHIGGAGTLQGKINLYGTNTTGFSRFDPVHGVGDISIRGITIDGEKINNGINSKWVFGVTIQGVTFKNCVKSINFEPISESHHCSRFTINTNRFWDCNYAIYVDYDPSNASAIFQVGDITFTSNVIESRNSGWAGTFGNIYHIWARGIDGLICESNTFFFSKVGSELSNIYLDNFNWVIIKGNQLYEAKEYGVKAINGQNLTISENNFAWTQKQSVWVSNIITCSINGNVFSWNDNGNLTVDRTGVYIEECPSFIGTVNDNKFFFPNEHAVKIKNSSNITLCGNTARNKHSVLEPVRVDSFATSGNINLIGNTFTGFSKTLESTLATLGTNSTISFTGNNEGKAVINRGIHSPMYKSYSRNETVVDISNTNLVVFANTQPTIITSITNEDLNNTFPRVVTLYSYNDNTTLSSTIPNITFKVAPNSSIVNIPAKESITFLVYGGTIRELSRSFQLANRIKTISDNSTTADVTFYDQINFNQPEVTTFTELTGTFTDGKIIDLIAFNGNTIISRKVANLKGGVDYNLPNKGLLRLKYTVGNWYEV